MLADFTFLGLNDMKVAVQKNHLGAEILYRSLNPSKKRDDKMCENFEIFCSKILNPVQNGRLYEPGLSVSLKYGLD